jgi:hypothetical protein
MSSLSKQLERINFQDKHFIGTVAFKNEERTLPDGSKIALGIDDGHWVLIHQPPAGQRIAVYKYDRHENKLMIDERSGGEKELADFLAHLKYFFDHAKTEDLVTLLPPGGAS